MFNGACEITDIANNANFDHIKSLYSENDPMRLSISALVILLTKGFSYAAGGTNLVVLMVGFVSYQNDKFYVFSFGDS